MFYQAGTRAEKVLFPVEAKNTSFGLGIISRYGSDELKAF